MSKKTITEDERKRYITFYEFQSKYKIVTLFRIYVDNNLELIIKSKYYDLDSKNYSPKMLIFMLINQDLLDKNRDINRITYTFDDSKIRDLMDNYEKMIKRNEKLLTPIFQVKETEPNVNNNYHSFKRSLYSSIFNTSMTMDIVTIKNEDETYRAYLSSSTFKQYNNEYTIYSSARDKKEDEKEKIFDNNFLNSIINKVYNTHRDMNTENIYLDIAIKWERNNWSALEANDTTERWSGKVIKGEPVLAALSKTFYIPDDPETKKLLLHKYFNEENTIKFFI